MCSRSKITDLTQICIIPDFASTSERSSNSKINSHKVYLWCKKYTGQLNKFLLQTSPLRNTADRSRKTKFAVLLFIVLYPLILPTTHAATMKPKSSLFVPSFRKAANINNFLRDMFAEKSVYGTIGEEAEIWKKGWIAEKLIYMKTQSAQINIISHRDQDPSEQLKIFQFMKQTVVSLISAYEGVIAHFQVKKPESAEKYKIEKNNPAKHAFYIDKLPILLEMIENLKEKLDEVIENLRTISLNAIDNEEINGIEIKVDERLHDVPEALVLLKLHHEVSKILMDLYVSTLGVKVDV